VQFRNLYTSGSTVINGLVTSAETGNLLDNSNTLWRGALLGGPLTGTAANVSAGVVGTLTQLYNPANTTLSWVNFRAAPNNGSVTVASASRVLNDVNWGAQGLVQMVAWQGAYDTWAAAFAAWQAGTPGVLIGASNPLTLTMPSSATDPNATYLVGLQGFSIVAVPEPTTFALAGLGAAALLIFRRRN
jgi:hypothetical protein